MRVGRGTGGARAFRVCGRGRDAGTGPPLLDRRSTSRNGRSPLPALSDGPALRRLRHPLPRADAEPLLVQLTARRLRDLPRLRPRDRRRLRPRRAGPEPNAARRRRAALADRVVPGVPGRPRAVRAQARRAARHALARAHRGASPLGDRRRGAVGEEGLVRRAAVLRVARDQELQDAHPRAAVEVPQLHALPGLRRRAAQARGAAVAARRRTGRPRASTSTT